MTMRVPEEHFGIYKFECGEETYTYKTENNREYTNEEFVNILNTSHSNWMYYKEPCTMWNDPDGLLVMKPRNEESDNNFLNNVRIILKYTKSEEKKQLINKILNKCLIIDEEPKLKDGYKLDDADIYFDKTESFGKYHIDQFKLKSIYRDAINMAVHKYIKIYVKDHYNSKEENNMNLLLNDK